MPTIAQKIEDGVAMLEGAQTFTSASSNEFRVPQSDTPSFKVVTADGEYTILSARHMSDTTLLLSTEGTMSCATMLIGGETAATLVGQSPKITSESLTAQTADIASTNFVNASTPGLYRVAYTLQCTTLDETAGSVTLTLAYTDDAGSATFVSSAKPLTSLGRTNSTAFIQLSSGSISYQTTHTGSYGTAQYGVHMTVERLA